MSLQMLAGVGLAVGWFFVSLVVAMLIMYTLWE
jgi:F0F1-type ATP synthase membrane subunit c/vacuolar-type H+-ATPase subunit K